MTSTADELRGTGRQRQRDEILLEVTRSLCPKCRKLIDAQVSMRDNKIFMRKRCPDHGQFEALMWSDAQMYLKAMPYNKPGTMPLQFNSEVRDGCPFDCGLCPDHQQHTCVGIIDVTGRCNLDCPVCFAGDEHSAGLSLEDVDAILDNLLRCEEWPDVVQFSGGEPTVHPQIINMLCLAKSKRIKAVMLNTNGLRIANDKRFVQDLAAIRPYIYVQFDGLEASTYERLRGRDLLNVKLRALDNLAEAGLGAILVTTVVKGVNDHEVGEIVKFGIKHPAVRGVSLQPGFASGRYLPPFDPLDRITIPDVIKAIEAQTDGMFAADDIIPIPCCYPTCSAASYALLIDDEVVPLPRLVEVEDYLDYFANRAIPEPPHEVMEALESLWSVSGGQGPDRAIQHMCTACGIDFSSLDEWNFDVKRAMKCCVHELLSGNRIVPFCVYNSAGYREKERQEPVVSAKFAEGDRGD